MDLSAFYVSGVDVRQRWHLRVEIQLPSASYYNVGGRLGQHPDETKRLFRVRLKNYFGADLER